MWLVLHFNDFEYTGCLTRNELSSVRARFAIEADTVECAVGAGAIIFWICVRDALGRGDLFMMRRRNSILFERNLRRSYIPWHLHVCRNADECVRYLHVSLDKRDFAIRLLLQTNHSFCSAGCLLWRRQGLPRRTCAACIVGAYFVHKNCHCHFHKFAVADLVTLVVPAC